MNPLAVVTIEYAGVRVKNSTNLKRFNNAVYDTKATRCIHLCMKWRVIILQRIDECGKNLSQ